MITSKPIKLLALSIVFLAILLIARFYYTKTLFFGFYIWNTFLALIPIVLSSLLLNQKNAKVVSFFIFLVWLMFFPNAAYLVTDILHFKERKDVPLWFDLVLVIQASWVGLYCAIISLKHVEIFLRKHFNYKLVFVIISLIILLASYGVYLGRFLRFNSWDFIVQPEVIIITSFDRLLHPFAHFSTWAFVFLFGFFVGLQYLCFNKLLKNSDFV